MCDELDGVAAEIGSAVLVGCAVLGHERDTPAGAYIELLLPRLEEWGRAIEDSARVVES